MWDLQRLHLGRPRWSGATRWSALACCLTILGEPLHSPICNAAENTTSSAEHPQLEVVLRDRSSRERSVVGRKACLDCHKAETAALMQTQHANSLEKLQAAPNTKQYAAKLNISLSSVATSALCVSCHATTQIRDNNALVALGGVSCESCHGPAGGVAGWLNTHAAYGPKGTKLADETASHRKQRLASCHKGTPYEP